MTPVSEAAALQEDLHRAHIEPFAWVVNRSLTASGSRDPALAARMVGEAKQIRRVTQGLARRTYVVPWSPNPPVGIAPVLMLSEQEVGSRPNELRERCQVATSNGGLREG